MGTVIVVRQWVGAHKVVKDAGHDQARNQVGVNVGANLAGLLALFDQLARYAAQTVGALVLDRGTDTCQEQMSGKIALWKKLASELSPSDHIYQYFLNEILRYNCLTEGEWKNAKNRIVLRYRFSHPGTLHGFSGRR